VETDDFYDQMWDAPIINADSKLITVMEHALDCMIKHIMEQEEIHHG
jgi:hypothetical protein